MSATDQIISDITAAVTPHSTSAVTATNPENPANHIGPPEATTATFTQQDVPLLLLPGE